MEALVREIARLIFDMLEVQSERCAYCGAPLLYPLPDTAPEPIFEPLN